MIRANPKVFDNEKFYEKVMRKRYPLLIEFRKENETWKALYLRMVYILAKLQEDYKIPYIPTKGCSPERLLEKGTERRQSIYDFALGCAAAGGHIHLIDLFLEKSDAIDTGLALAGQYSNVNTVKYLISKGATDYKNLLGYAAFGGNIEVMKFALDLLKFEGWNINPNGYSILRRAILNEQFAAIDFLVQNGLIIDRDDIQYSENVKKYEVAKYLQNFL